MATPCIYHCLDMPWYACSSSNSCKWNELSLPSDDALSHPGHSVTQSVPCECQQQRIPTNSWWDSNQDCVGTIVAWWCLHCVSTPWQFDPSGMEYCFPGRWICWPVAHTMCRRNQIFTKNINLVPFCIYWIYCISCCSNKLLLLLCASECSPNTR